MIKKILPLLSILFASVVIAEELQEVETIPSDIKSAKLVVPIYSQRVGLRIPTDWKQASQSQTANAFILEFTPKTEDINSWRNMISVQGFKDLASLVSSEQFFDDLASQFRSVCGEYLVYEKIGSPIINGYESTTAILGCSKLPNAHPSGVAKGQSEVGFYVTIQGKNDIYMIHRSIRGDSFENGEAPLSRADLASFVELFAPIELCEKQGGPDECRQ